jgi:hypothetical protein
MNITFEGLPQERQVGLDHLPKALLEEIGVVLEEGAHPALAGSHQGEVEREAGDLDAAEDDFGVDSNEMGDFAGGDADFAELGDAAG